MRATYNAVYSVMAKRKKENILDVGCGDGLFLEFLLNKGYKKVRGCDIKSIVKSYEIDEADATDLPYEDGFFDVVTLINVMEHTENPRLAIKEAKRVLKGGGEIIIVVPNVNNIFSRIYFLLKGKLLFHREHEYKTVQHITILPDWLIERYLEELDLILVSKTPTKSVLPFIHTYLPNRLFWCEGICLKIRKV